MSKSTLIKSNDGKYRTSGDLTLKDIIDHVVDLLYQEISSRESLTKSSEAAEFLQLSLACEKNENFVALFLDSQHRVLKFEKLFRGTIDGASVHPRVVVQKGLACNAAAVIFAHNHPSGHCEPSKADLEITRTLKEALALVDVRVLDHFVVSQTGWVSMAERGLI